MRKIRSSSLAAVAFVALLAVPAGAAQSVAPSYVSSEPGDGEELHRAPDRVEVTFTEPLDESSDLIVRDSCGRTVDDGRPTVEANTISVGIRLKPSGRYRVTYLARGLGGVTGYTKDGFHFMVHLGPACGGGDGGGGHDGHGDDDGAGGAGDGGGGHGAGGSGHPTASGGGGHPSTGQDSGGGHSSSMRTGGSGGGSMDHGRGGSGKHDGRHGARHGKRHGQGHGQDHGGHPAELAAPGDDERTAASGELGLAAAPDGGAVLMALGLSLMLGVVGGWFLRLSGAR